MLVYLTILTISGISLSLFVIELVLFVRGRLGKRDYVVYQVMKAGLWVVVGVLSAVAVARKELVLGDEPGLLSAVVALVGLL